VFRILFNFVKKSGIFYRKQFYLSQVGHQKLKFKTTI